MKMSALKKACFILLAACTILFVLDNASRYEPRDFPKKGTLADKHRYWSSRAEMFRLSANAQFEKGKESSGRIDLAAATECDMKARSYRDLHNRELSVSLWRSLATIGSAPETAEYYAQEYAMRKL